MDLSPVERAIILDLGEHGDNIPANIAENSEKHVKSVSRSLANLEEEGLVRNKGRGVYTLTPEGKEARSALLEEGRRED